MPTTLMYPDALQNDNDLNDLLASLHLGSPVIPRPSQPRSTRRPREDPYRFPDSTTEWTVYPPAPSTLPGPLSVPHVVPPATESTPPRIYDVTSNTINGLVGSWSAAAHATQREPFGHAVELTGNRSRKPRRKAAIVVYQGLAVGIYKKWAQCKDYVLNIPSSIYEGFKFRIDAERAFVLAYALGAVRILPNTRGVTFSAQPTPQAIMDSLEHVADDFAGEEWHVVFKGKQPGIYPTWCFAATQTLNVSRSVYRQFSTRREAQDAFSTAQAAGEVESL